MSFWGVLRKLTSQAGFTVKDDDIDVIPRPAALILAWLAERIFGLLFWGGRQPAFTAAIVKYTTFTPTLDIT